MNAFKRMTPRRIGGLAIFICCLVLVVAESWMIGMGRDYLLSDLAHEYLNGINAVTFAGGVGIGFLLNHFIFRW